MRYCVQPATAKDVAILALSMADEDAGDVEYDRDSDAMSSSGRSTIC